MNLIPDKNLFLVTSAIKPLDSVFFTDEQRMHQTIDTLISIRKKVPKSIIILAEASFNPLSDGEKTILQQFCNGYIDLSTQTDVRGFSGVKLKSQAETAERTTLVEQKRVREKVLAEEQQKGLTTQLAKLSNVGPQSIAPKQAAVCTF
jgi:hypothetical protein